MTDGDDVVDWITGGGPKEETDEDGWPLSASEIRSDPYPMYFDRQGNPISMKQWAMLSRFDADPGKRVAETTIGPLWVSTVWLGMDYGFRFLQADDDPEPYRPMIFESMVFQSDRPDLSDVDRSLPLSQRMAVFLAAIEAQEATLHPELRAILENPYRWHTEAEAIAGHDQICVDLRTLLAHIEMADEVMREAVDKVKEDTQ